MATNIITDTSMSDAAGPASTWTSTEAKAQRLPVTVTKPIPYTFDLAHLLANDPNPLPPTSTLLKNLPTSTNSTLQAIARDGAQTLLNQLLTTCPIHSTPDGLSLTLPSPALTPLPRWKPVPKPKAPTTWEAYAKKKGIGKYGGSMKGGAKLAERKRNLVFDEASGEWVKRWGFKGGRKEGEVPADWLVEVDGDAPSKRSGKEDNSAAAGESARSQPKKERMERLRRQQRKERNNLRNSRDAGGAG